MNFDPASEHLLFRPDSFFLKAWRGWGVGLDRRGRVNARYEAKGEGRTGARTAHVEHVFTFEDGRVQTSQWDIVSDEEGRYVARDPRTGLEARGAASGRDFSWSFKAPAPGKLKGAKVDVHVLFTRVAEGAAFSFTTVKLLGLTLATYTTFYEHA
jgi:hypothetical protein